MLQTPGMGAKLGGALSNLITNEVGHHLLLCRRWCLAFGTWCLVLGRLCLVFRRCSFITSILIRMVEINKGRRLNSLTSKRPPLTMLKR